MVVNEWTDIKTKRVQQTEASKQWDWSYIPLKEKLEELNEAQTQKEF